MGDTIGLEEEEEEEDEEEEEEEEEEVFDGDEGLVVIGVFGIIFCV